MVGGIPVYTLNVGKKLQFACSLGIHLSKKERDTSAGYLEVSLWV